LSGYAKSRTCFFDDQRSSYKHRQEFYAPNGLADYVAFLNRDFEPIHEPIAFKEAVELKPTGSPTNYVIVIDIAIQYSSRPDTLMVGFVNVPETNVKWGTHTDGMRDALTGTIGYFAQKLGYTTNKDFLTWYDIKAGLAAIISVRHPYPSLNYERAGYARLINPELAEPIDKAVSQAYEQFAAEQPDAMKRIIEHCLENKRRCSLRSFGE
jgi:DNA gyrase/topoisomerase IV subunit B